MPWTITPDDLPTGVNIWTANQIFNDDVKLFFGTSSDASIRYNGTNLIIDPQEVGSGNVIINAGSLDLNNQGGILNVGAAGNDWTAQNLNHGGAFDGSSINFLLSNTSNTGSSDALFRLQVAGTSAGDPKIRFDIVSGETMSIGLDNTTDDFTISDGEALGTNDRLRLTATTGVLSVDGDGGGADDPVLLFDEYDDALELRRYQLAIRQAPISVVERDANRQRMVDLGIGEWAIQSNGTYHFMDRVQPLTRLLAGGIYQNRWRMDEQYHELDQRLKAVGA